MTPQYRTEQDFLGQKEIPAEALYGIHSQRAKENFPDTTAFHIEWYKAVAVTKLACYFTYRDFKKAALLKYKNAILPIHFMEDEIIESLIEAAEKISSGKYIEHFIVPAIQGGAGTSINMNINEIIANIALLSLNKNQGDYEIVDPIEHANIYQSTNDVIPTSLKIAVIKLLVELEEVVNNLRFDIEKIEKQNRNKIRIGYTQMQQAVPSSFDKLFSAYNDALSRDWWRISKCFERIKVVNLGGSAIGTGITVPRFFIMEVVNHLQRITGLPITRSENLFDATSNLDTYVEVHAIMKAHAVNLEKMVSDIRLLASDLIPNNELIIPQKQAGSSIMPGKVNPVIPEFVISVAHRVYSNDSIITSLSAQGCLELNAYIPLIGHALIDSLKLLIAANRTLRSNLFNGLIVNAEIAYQKVMNSPVTVTALVPFIGYHKAGLLAKEMKQKDIDIFQANKNLNLIHPDKLQKILEPQNLLKKGFTLDELVEND